MSGRSFLAPEVLQISAMDCGVAAIACMLSGYGIDANYERLREACQTQIDGTSIDALEDVCGELGLNVCQHIVPADLVETAMSTRMPLIAVTAPSTGRLHYVTVWRSFRDRIQVMDPGGGRLWQKNSTFEASLHVHVQRFSIEEWTAWFAGSAFAEALATTARASLSSAVYGELCAPAIQQGDPKIVGALDAALRLLRKTVKVTAKPRSWRDALFRLAFNAAIVGGHEALPAGLWAVNVAEDQVSLRGGVLLAVPQPKNAGATQARISGQATERFGTSRKVSLFANIREVLGSEARSFLGWLFVGIVVLALASGIELIVYRSLLELPQLLTTALSRAGGAVALVTLLIVLAGLEASIISIGNRLGRVVEIQLRTNTLWSLPRVDDEFVRSRPTSDLAYRAQSLSMGALLVPSLVAVTRAVADLTVTLVGMAILDVRYAAAVLVGSFLFFVVWRASRSQLQEVDARLQVHASRFLGILLDSMRGIRPVRLHGFQDAFRDDQRAEIVQWKRSAQAQAQTASVLQVRYTTLATLLVTALFGIFLRTHGDPRAFVVLAFWSFRIPPIIRRLVQFAQTYPQQRNAVERLIEVTRYAADSVDDEAPLQEEGADPRGVAIRMSDVSVVLGGQTVLSNVSLDIPAGQHVAIVGASGSGKSTLVGLLLGLHRPTSGTVFVDERPLDTTSRQALRAVTMWIDPAVQLWNESLGDNLDYASRGYARRNALNVLEASDLLGVLASLEKGLDAPVGADGAFISGGEGQRVRVGRAMFRAGTRLALLDEPFRGLDRPTRSRIMSEVRRSALRSTMLFVSHDIAHALSFERVLVVDKGRIVEDGSPQELSTLDSRFARLLNAERELLETAWSGRRWRRLRVQGGRVHEVDNRA